MRAIQDSNQGQIEMVVADQLGDFGRSLTRYGASNKSIEAIMRPTIGELEVKLGELRGDIEEAFKQVQADAKSNQEERRCTS